MCQDQRRQLKCNHFHILETWANPKLMRFWIWSFYFNAIITQWYHWDANKDQNSRESQRRCVLHVFSWEPEAVRRWTVCWSTLVSQSCKSSAWLSSEVSQGLCGSWAACVYNSFIARCWKSGRRLAVNELAECPCEFNKMHTALFHR